MAFNPPALFLSLKPLLVTGYLSHNGWTAIENINTIDERGSKIAKNSVFDCNLMPVLDKKSKDQSGALNSLILTTVHH